MTNTNITEKISRNVNYFNIIFLNCTPFLRVLNFKIFFSVEVTILPDLFQSYCKVHWLLKHWRFSLASLVWRMDQNLLSLCWTTWEVIASKARCDLSGIILVYSVNISIFYLKEQWTTEDTNTLSWSNPENSWETLTWITKDLKGLCLM